jgi:hypothetical protein
MSYRKPEFNFERIKPHMSMDLGDRLQKGEIAFYPSMIPVEIIDFVNICNKIQS